MMRYFIIFGLSSVILVGTAAGQQITDKTIQTVVDGSSMPYTDPAGVPNDWYGRNSIAIVDQNRWIMALRSGVNHISWGSGDTIHLMTSTNEGRTWGPLNRWFDGTPVAGLSYYDGKTHSEPGLYKMPNGDFILQYWKDSYNAGTKQMRSTDNGKTWVNDISRINITGVTGGVPGDRAIGTQDYFTDPENPSSVYMAFQYFHYNSQAGSLLAKSTDNGKNYSFVNWISPLASETNPDSGATFEPAIEYVGDRTIVSVLRDYANQHTWQTVSTDMGLTFSTPVDISEQIDGGIPGGVWQRVRLFKESNPDFQYDNQLDYSAGEGLLWGFGIHSNGGGYTRKPVVYWSDDNGDTWHGPESLHGEMFPGTDTGYGDLKRRTDGTFVAATYYANSNSTVADSEQYTFTVTYPVPEPGILVLLATGLLGLLCYAWRKRR